MDKSSRLRDENIIYFVKFVGFLFSVFFISTSLFSSRPTDPDFHIPGIQGNMAYKEPADKFATTHFMIHYVKNEKNDHKPPLDDINDNNVPDYIDTMGDLLERAYQFEVKEMGYLPPFGDGDIGGEMNLIDVYILNPGEYPFSGLTKPEYTSSGDYGHCFIILSNNLKLVNPGKDDYYRMKKTIAHELHHAIQYGYNREPEKWLMEATSYWMEGEVFDDVNQDLLVLKQWFNNPGDSLDVEEDLYIYGNWIWIKYLSERFGPDIIKEIWKEQIWKEHQKRTSLNAIDKVLYSKGTNLSNVFIDFTTRNYMKTPRFVGDPYEEYPTYPDIKIENGKSPHDEYPVQPQDVDINHLASKYYKFIPNPDDSAKTLIISFKGSKEKECGAVVIIETKDNKKIEKKLDLGNLPLQDTYNYGTFAISGFGANYKWKHLNVESVVLIMNNTEKNGDPVTLTYLAECKDGPDIQITPWGWDWGGKPPFWQSTDIWVKNDDSESPTDQPVIGKNNKLYARIRNLGNEKAEDVKLTFYYRPAGIGDFEFKIIGEKKCPDLDEKSETNVSIDWDLTNPEEDFDNNWPAPIKNYDHFCVKVVIECRGDVNDKNNFAESNFANVSSTASDLPGPNPIRFIIANPYDRPTTARLIIDNPSPEHWKINFKELVDFNGFQLQAKEKKVITMIVTPPQYVPPEDPVNYATEIPVNTTVQTPEKGYSHHAKITGKKGVLSEQLVNICVQINGEMIGGMSYNLILLRREEYKKWWSIGIHGGRSLPVGSFSSVYDPGWSKKLDIGYHFTPKFSLVCCFGYNHLKAGSSLVDDTYYWNLAVNLKYEFITNPIKPYINAGPGFFVPKTGPIKPGLNVGAGVNYRFTLKWTIELGINYHYVFNGFSKPKFCSAHTGLIYRF
ncbi:MAG: DUF6055 domain-containing protein [Candidatus Aminicenantes bacterium]|jgi:hypothetical protein